MCERQKLRCVNWHVYKRTMLPSNRSAELIITKWARQVCMCESEHNGTVKLLCKASHDEVSASGLNKLLSEASFIKIWSRKDARNRPSLVENRSAEDKLRRAEGKLRRAEGKLRRAEENSEGRSTLLKRPSENPVFGNNCVLCVDTRSSWSHGNNPNVYLLPIIKLAWTQTGVNAWK